MLEQDAINCSKPSYPAWRNWLGPGLRILSFASILLAFSFWLDVYVISPKNCESTAFQSFPTIFFQQDVEQARNTLSGLGEVLAAILGLAITVSSITVQLAATRFTPHVTTLFFRARTHQTILGFFIISALYVVWINFFIGPQVPHWGVLISMLLMTISLIILFPYFNHVLEFLDPEKIVRLISTNGLAAANPQQHHVQMLEREQEQVVKAIEHLTNISLNAMQQKDKNIASRAVDELCKLAIIYGGNKQNMRPTWYQIPGWARQSPDFVSLPHEAIHQLEADHVWLEWKLLRQYQMLFTEGLVQIKDLCYLIAINTRRLGEAASMRNDFAVVDFAIKFFNTYLRLTINFSDIRTAYNTLHQYRQLGERILMHSQTDNLSVSAQVFLQKRAIDIVRYMRYYSSLSFQREMQFITEVIAHDIGSLCSLAFQLQSACHDEMLDIFLEIDDALESTEQEKTLRGVRRAQIKLATTYLEYQQLELENALPPT